MWRIGQTGVPHAKETRLDVYAALVGRTFYPLTIGDEESQKGDLANLRETANRLERDGLL